MNIVWYRTDLRVRDNTALARAMLAGPTVALYIATPGQWRQHDDAPIKQDFWRRNLMALEQALKALNVPLLCLEVNDYRRVPGAIGELIDGLNIQGLYVNAEYPLNEARRDQAVATESQKRGVAVSTCHDALLIPPGGILNNSGEPFKVFTPFSRKARQHIADAGIPAIHGLRPQAKMPPISAVKQRLPIAALGWPAPDKAWSALWPAGESHALKRLDDFTRQGIQGYKRNRDFPAIDGTSTLSPWLAAGVVSIRDCWRQAGAHHDGDGVDTWRNELLWREFYRHIIHHYEHVNMGAPFRRELAGIAWQQDDAAFAAWCEGKTGIPIVDAAMRQLLETGWMHNRLRMVSAMFLAKHLLIDWRRGERWFMQHLVDGDFAANNGGWQWSASTGTDAVPYFRVFNPVTQSRRFDEGGDFIRRYVPELAALDNKAIHEPGPLRPTSYPAPVIDLKFGRARAIAAFKGSPLGRLPRVDDR